MDRLRRGARGAALSTAVIVLATLTAAGLTGLVGTRGATGPSAAGQPTDDLGAALYGRDCAGCHGPDGEGSPRGLPIADVGEAATHYMLVTGRMPIRDPETTPTRAPSRYTDEEIQALVTHVAGFGDGPELPELAWREADAAQGGVLYRLHCGACHGATASGGALAFSRFAPSLRQSEPSVVTAAVVSGPGAMPAFGPQGFTDDELASIVAYVQEIRQPIDRGGWPIFRTGRPDEALVTWAIAIPVLLVAAGWLARRVR